METTGNIYIYIYILLIQSSFCIRHWLPVRVHAAELKIMTTPPPHALNRFQNLDPVRLCRFSSGVEVSRPKHGQVSVCFFQVGTARCSFERFIARC